MRRRVIVGIVQIALKRSFLEPFCCWKCGQFDGNSLYLEGLQQQADHVQAARVVELQQLWASTARGLRVRPVRALGWRGGWPSGGASLAPAPAAAPGAVALAVALALALHAWCNRRGQKQSILQILARK